MKHRPSYLFLLILLVFSWMYWIFPTESEHQLDKPINANTSPSIRPSLPQINPFCSRSNIDEATKRTVAKLFHSKPRPVCRQQEVKICAFKGLVVKCRPKHCTRGIQLGVHNPQTGDLIWIQVISSASLEDEISRISAEPFHKHLGFCFVQCRNRAGSEDRQLLLLPLSAKSFISEHIPRHHHHKINLNIIIIDSVSRDHFYRSLPKTINRLQSETNRFVADYRNVQSLKARTHESMKALFTGEVDVKHDTFELKDLARVPIKYEKFFEPLHNAGFRTVWLEDLCWKYEWGLVNDLAVEAANKWVQLGGALTRSKITTIGASPISCEIFKRLNVTDPFHEPLEVCFNAINHQDYLLRQLNQLQQHFYDTGTPFASVFTANIAHEDTGRRIQMIDGSLADYLRQIENINNMITIIASDHGNTYGEYPESTWQGRLESVNPALFIVIPSDIDLAVHQLKRNQVKLLTLQDVHATLQDIVKYEIEGIQPDMNSAAADPNSGVSLFRDIDSKRKCSDLSLLQPNLCICEGHEIKTLDEESALLAEFAVGNMNEMIVKASRLERQFECQRLYGVSFGPVMLSQTDAAKAIRTFEVVVNAIGTSEESFRVAVMTDYTNMTALGSHSTSAMTFLGYQRISAHDKYASCESYVHLPQLCLCNTAMDAMQVEIFNQSYLQSMFNASSMISLAPQSKCLYVLSRRHPSGAAFEIANTCVHATKVEFVITGGNIMTSHAMPRIMTVVPGEISFLTIVQQLVVHLPWRWTYDIEYVEIAGAF